MADPFDIFGLWFKEACVNESTYPDAMCLSTVSKTGQPHSRYVLLKNYSPKGFVFFTHLHSQKGVDIAHNARVALNFYWKSLQKQVRIEGEAILVDDKMADEYFATRPTESKLGAWASKQSSVLKNRKDLDGAMKMYADEFYHEGIPRPPHWSGYCVVPHLFEFWVEKPFRLHERVIFKKEHGHWLSFDLYP